MRWERGRQGTGYFKLRLAQGRRWDLYLLRYPPGSSVPPHRDPVPGKKHSRANLLLWGEDAFEGRAWLRLPRLVVFRPDITEHEVAPVSRLRLVLSLGWVRPLSRD
ncbi:MAG TPA: hypothetical protein VGJ91_12040 [Polyangiaceae bacterium]